MDTIELVSLFDVPQLTDKELASLYESIPNAININD